MMRTPCRPGLPAREQHRAGRQELLTTPFAAFEQSVRAQLTRMLGAGGFDATRDILALTVNRWPHGYAYQYNSLWDPFWIDGGPPPCRPGLPAREQHRAGRQELLTTPFAAFEQSVRAQLTRMLGAGGFDATRDILALTVNRWPHGYAYQYNSLWDPFWIDGGPLPC